MNTNKNILYWNCASGIFNKIDVIKFKIQEQKPDVFFISEADLNEKMDLNLLGISEFTLATSKTFSDVRKSRLCAYYNNSWTLNEEFMSEKDELIILEHENLSIIGIYRPFKLLQGETATTNFLRLLAKIQDYLDKCQGKNVSII